MVIVLILASYSSLLVFALCAISGMSYIDSYLSAQIVLALQLLPIFRIVVRKDVAQEHRRATE